MVQNVQRMKLMMQVMHRLYQVILAKKESIKVVFSFVYFPYYISQSFPKECSENNMLIFLDRTKK